LLGEYNKSEHCHAFSISTTGSYSSVLEVACALRLQCIQLS